MCYFFSDVIKLEDFDFDNILIDKNQKENVLIYGISNKTFIGPKTLRIRFTKIEGDLLEFMMKLDI